MKFHAIAARRRCLSWAAALLCSGPLAAPLTTQEIVDLCANADDPPHCGKLIEGRQLRNYPAVASRDGRSLTIQPRGKREPIRYTDSDPASTKVRDYSLWDVLDPIDYAVVWLQEGEASRYLLVNRVSGSAYELPGEPMLSPDQRYIASADFCVRGCANELALWEVQPQGLRKARVYGATRGWKDAAVRWKDARTLAVDVEIAAAPANENARGEYRSLIVPLDDPAWRAP